MHTLSNIRNEELSRIQSKTNYKFNKLELLNRALTHSSYANEHKKNSIKYNERLEFLGDSVLGIVISDYLFNQYPQFPEGELTKFRAIIVCENSLANVSRKINLGMYLLLGKGEEATGGRERASILADAFEALIGAIYLDGGINCAKQFILTNLKLTINNAISGRLFTDFKTELQEYLQKSNDSKIEYKVFKEEGPDHNKTFYVHVEYTNKILGKGIGKSKKEAEQNAAKAALEKVGAFSE